MERGALERGAGSMEHGGLLLTPCSVLLAPCSPAPRYIRQRREYRPGDSGNCAIFGRTVAGCLTGLTGLPERASRLHSQLGCGAKSKVQICKRRDSRDKSSLIGQDAPAVWQLL